MMIRLKILIFGNKSIQIGEKSFLKWTSRIKIWDKSGKIIIGDNFSIGYNSEIYTWGGDIVVEKNTSINDNCKIYGNVKIGANCLLASNIFISSGSHVFKKSPFLPIKVQDSLYFEDKPIIIEDDCWIGFGVVIMPGVHVGKGAIVGSNAVVTKDVFPYSINVGIPSREIGKRLSFENSFDEINCKIPDHWPYFYKGINYNQFDSEISVKEGIEIINPIAVFLLSKKSIDKLQIRGFSNTLASLKIFLNKSKFNKIEIKDGFFDIVLDLTLQNECGSKEFDNISKEIKGIFNVITIESDLIVESLPVNKIYWKIISISYYGN
jgi:acetyltransferase-like isoleucine patch superfamily enzyme